MSVQAVWTPVAESELDDILYYIAYQDRRPETGERIYYGIRHIVEKHAQSQLPGRIHPNAPEGWYYIRFKRWLIFYHPHPEGIEIMRVIDGVRDLPRQLF